MAMVAHVDVVFEDFRNVAPNQQKLAESDGRLLAQVTAIPYGYPTCIVCVCICT